MWPTPPTPMTATRRTGAEPRYELLDGVVGGDAGVGVRCDVRRGRPGRQRNERALVDQHVVCKSAVSREPGELMPFAVHVQPAPARHAEPAAVRRVDEDRVADPRRRHVVAGCVHPAGVLVAEHERQRDADGVHQPVDRVQVGRADAGTADAHDDVACAERLGLGALDELETRVIVGEERGLHAAVPR